MLRLSIMVYAALIATAAFAGDTLPFAQIDTVLGVVTH